MAEELWLEIRTGPGKGESVRFEGPELTIGRGEDCGLTLEDSKASRAHARISADPGGGFTIEDLGSANGTFVNRRAVSKASLGGGEQVQIGDTVLAVSRTAPGVRPGATVLESDETRGRTRARSQSSVVRLLETRSRRATALSLGAVGVAGLVAALALAGVFSGSGPSAEVQRVVDRARGGTVLVVAGGDAARGTSGETGSGWVLDAAHGLVVTNAHVVNGGGPPFRVGVGTDVRHARLLGQAPCEDLALLRLADHRGLHELPLGRQSRLRQGQTVVAVGFPGGGSAEPELTSTTGVVSVVRRRLERQGLDVPAYPNAVQTDAAINPGSSGGPLLDLRGRVVGVNSAARTLNGEGRIIQGQGFAIGVDRVTSVLQSLRAGHSPASAGLRFDYASPARLRRRGLPLGLPVAGTLPGTPAASARVPAATALTAVKGMAVGNALGGYCDALRGVGAGSTVPFRFAGPRGRHPRTVRLAVG